MKNLYQYPILSATAIDGDTIRTVLDLGFNLSLTMNCRVSGIDTPEIKTLAGRAVYGVIVKWLTSVGRLTAISYHWDKYACRYDGEILGGELGMYLSSYLFQHGLAKSYDGKSPRAPWSPEELAQVQARAEALLND